ncbi:iron-sulfur cluster assembly protein [Saccharopolyspora pogona]|uniref:iron-sulfur cluster assembly protein n=1 Tax=Saccharopolyspora pogona TaxID=333966 RepID=UPI001687CE8C|nr:iron-sulfur cluster assembly protein [Saccharopolyspora pogona]
MNAELNSSLLRQVWDVLGGIRPPGEQHSLTELGFVTAVSTNGVDVRILLRVPKAMCWTEGQSQLLADLEKAVRGMLTLGKVELTVKPYKGVLDISDPLPCTTMIGDHGSDASAFHPAAPATGPVDHYGCLADAVDSGWIIDDVEQTKGRCGSRNHELRTASVRVFIRARVEQHSCSPAWTRD